jgi:hypothetical protein
MIVFFIKYSARNPEELIESLDQPLESWLGSFTPVFYDLPWITNNHCIGWYISDYDGSGPHEGMLVYSNILEKDHLDSKIDIILQDYDPLSGFPG